MPEHVHMLISIPPKYAVLAVVGYIKGKSAIQVARHFMKRERNYVGQKLWARGYFVEASDTLTSASWTTLIGSIAGNGDTQEVEISVAAETTRKFYRLRLDLVQ